MFGRIRNRALLPLLLLLVVPAVAAAQQGIDLRPVENDGDNGPKISLDVQDAEIGGVLRSLASFSDMVLPGRLRVVAISQRMAREVWRSGWTSTGT